MRVFPTTLFGFAGTNVDVERRTISGGEALNGQEDVVETDGGGRWAAEFSDAYLDEPRYARAWSAIAKLGETQPIVVLFTDARNQGMGEAHQPLGGLPWWNDTDFPPSEGAYLKTSAALRATTVTITRANLPAPIDFGMRFSLKHDVMRERAYEVVELLSVSGADFTCRIHPPLRQATPSGTACDFLNPRCVMRLDGSMSSPISMGFADGSVRFVEHFAESYA